MRILHITATHLNKYGGIPVVLERLVTHQNELINVRSVVLSIRHPTNYIKSSNFVFLKDKEDIRKFITKYEPDVVIFHGVYFLKYINVYKFLHKTKVKYFIQPHGSFMKSAQKKGAIKKRIVNSMLLSNFIYRAHGYIFLNNRELNESLYRTRNDIIIPNGISKNAFTAKKEINQSVKILFLGRIDINHKGLDILLEQLRKIDLPQQDFSVDFYGVGNKKEIKRLETDISNIKNIRVAYKGPVYDDDKHKVLLEYNIMILTSRYEGFPMTILEALSYGIPCIVTSGTNVRELIEVNGLGWGTDDSRIAETIEIAVKDYRINKDELAARAVEFVEKNYSWSDIAKYSIKKIDSTLRMNL